jgi:hypothetical protein
VLMGNGGRGIHVFLSDNVDVVNNTTFENSWTPSIEDGEISAIESTGVFIGNNIVQPLAYRPSFTVNPGDGVDPAAAVRFGSNLFDRDPLFVDPSTGNFTLRTGSPGIDAGDRSVAPPTDIFGVPRPQGGAVDLGAYER